MPRRLTAEPPSGVVVAVVEVERLKVKLCPEPSRVHKAAESSNPVRCATPVPERLTPSSIPTAKKTGRSFSPRPVKIDYETPRNPRFAARVCERGTFCARPQFPRAQHRGGPPWIRHQEQRNPCHPLSNPRPCGGCRHRGPGHQ